MKRAVDYWSNKLGFLIADQWSYKNGQFDTSGVGEIYATWLYVGGNTRLGLWLPRDFSERGMLIAAEIHYIRPGSIGRVCENYVCFQRICL